MRRQLACCHPAHLTLGYATVYNNPYPSLLKNAGDGQGWQLAHFQYRDARFPRNLPLSAVPGLFCNSAAPVTVSTALTAFSFASVAAALAMPKKITDVVFTVLYNAVMGDPIWYHQRPLPILELSCVVRGCAMSAKLYGHRLKHFSSHDFVNTGIDSKVSLEPDPEFFAVMLAFACNEHF